MDNISKFLTFFEIKNKILLDTEDREFCEIIKSHNLITIEKLKNLVIEYRKETADLKTSIIEYSKKYRIINDAEAFMTDFNDCYTNILLNTTANGSHLNEFLYNIITYNNNYFENYDKCMEITKKFPKLVNICDSFLKKIKDFNTKYLLNSDLDFENFHEWLSEYENLCQKINSICYKHTSITQIYNDQQNMKFETKSKFLIETMEEYKILLNGVNIRILMNVAIIKLILGHF